MVSQSGRLSVTFQTPSVATLLRLSLSTRPCLNLATCVAPDNTAVNPVSNDGNSDGGKKDVNDLMEYSDSSSSGLTATAIILIVLAAVLILLIVVIFLIAYCHKKHKMKYESDSNSAEKNNA